MMLRAYVGWPKRKILITSTIAQLYFRVGLNTSLILICKNTRLNALTRGVIMGTMANPSSRREDPTLLLVVSL